LLANRILSCNVLSVELNLPSIFLIWYGIGICSVEEIGTIPPTIEKIPPQHTNVNGTGPNVRDRLCQIIRQHSLDAELVKAYAVDYCGSKTLRDAAREQVENFVQESPTGL
jgi:hypothetical protein